MFLVTVGEVLRVQFNALVVMLMIVKEFDPLIKISLYASRDLWAAHIIIG
jgi:hypothetical protein